MIYLAIILNIISGTFIWFFLGDLAFKVSPIDAIIVFSLLFFNIVTKKIIELGVKK
jgi:hypothetical protein